MHSILVVDDSPDNIRVLHGVLKDRYKVLAAASGEAALGIMQTASIKPSLMLLDLVMPGLDGFETLEQFKTLSGSSDVPVIFISANEEVAAKTRGFALGAVDYITKPFDPDEVLARVATHLALRDARIELDRQNKELAEAARLREDVERIMRHDLKSPLNAIIGTAQFELDNEDVGGRIRESFEVIAQSGVAMLEMINLSLDLFKMERGLYQLNPAAVELASLLDRLARELEPILRAGRINLDRGAVSRMVKPARGEPLLCYSLLGNLLKNAVEASPSGGSINLLLENRAAGPFLRIRNAGEIPAQLRGKLFTKFATAGKSGGSGLGLYSARLIAGTMGASIEADSSEPGYTSFIVQFEAMV